MTTMEMNDVELESSPELAARWGVTRARIHQMIQQGLIPQAKRTGRDWVIIGRPDRPSIMRKKEIANGQVAQNQEAD